MKFKIGDKVRIKNSVVKEFLGVTGTVIRIKGNKVYCNNWSDNRDKDCEGFMLEKDWELVSPKIPVKDYTPKVGDVVESNGDNLSILIDSDNRIVKGTVVRIEKNSFYIDSLQNGNRVGGNNWSIWKDNPIAWIKVIKRADEEDIKPEDDFKSYFYNGSINLTPSGEINKSKGKIMSVIKNIFKGEKQKALENYGITNGDGGLTNSGRDEFIDYLYETLTEERKGFISKIVEQYKKDKE